jgi:hypothetical protein
MPGQSRKRNAMVLPRSTSLMHKLEYRLYLLSIVILKVQMAWIVVRKRQKNEAGGGLSSSGRLVCLCTYAGTWQSRQHKTLEVWAPMSIWQSATRGSDASSSKSQ